MSDYTARLVGLAFGLVLYTSIFRVAYILIGRRGSNDIHRPFSILNLSFSSIVLSLMALYATYLFEPGAKTLPLLYFVIIGLSVVAYFTSLGILASRLGESAGLWILATILIPLFGLLIGFISMRGIVRRHRATWGELGFSPYRPVDMSISGNGQVESLSAT